ncbi:TniQ family protein [Mycolicibacterium goodii]|uniref:TniQ family protein n=1 Tax=Mycolicibacterium goodii TaxID=134601 RepID=A0ABS6HWD6_MYCGD|nr:TniQ family protein [Mycolicibacterium goodii]MBU8826956.1 TniQ family protein [Mycolicibacterium goodii]MBU8841411.1 TniQ family protein [Mycolicibacterium goodii]OKH71839.1 hypothetical protein EB74_24560 [Mycobacterium sp. SWH-M5]
MNPVASTPSRRIRTLPVRLAPIPGEALDSWLEALAARSPAAWGDLLDTVGLRDPDGTGRPRHPVDTPSTDLESLSTATGVDTEVLASMLRTGLGLHAADDDAALRDFTLPGSRYCPACLADSGGRWMLWWRLRWAFACPTHRCLLTDDCPQCQRPQRTRPIPLEIVPAPGRCALPGGVGRSSPRCGADLSSARTPRLPKTHLALKAQRAILAVVAAGCASEGVYREAPVTAAQYLRDLTALGMRALRYGSAADLQAVGIGCTTQDPLRAAVESSAAHRLHSAVPSPPTAAQTAVAACAAAPVLAADTVPAAGEHLRWLITSSRAQGLAVSPTNMIWAHGTSDTLTSVQLAALTPHLAHAFQVRLRCHSPRPRPAPHSVPPVHRSLPALFWYRWALPVADTPVGFEQLRLGLSAAVALAAGHRQLDQACRSLDNVTTGKQASRVLQALAARPDWPETALMLGEMADLLTEYPAPIDYERRRHLSTDTLLPEALWHKICRDVGFTPGSGLRIRFIRCWLYERITGSPARLCGDAVNTATFRAVVADIPRVLYPEMVTALDNAARQFLDDHGLRDEPLRWSPPAHALPSWTRLRPVDTALDIAALHTLVRPRDCRLGAVAERLRAPIELVREVLNDQPAPRPVLTAAQRRTTGAVTADAQKQLSREYFAELYLNQQLSLKKIGEMVGASRQTMGRLARAYGIPLRPSSVGRPPGAPK